MALDLATNTGFADGVPGSLPTLGSIRFGGPGGSQDAAFAEAMGWIGRRIIDSPPAAIVIEAPVAPSFFRGATNINTLRKLIGLAAVVSGTAYRLGFYRVHEASVGDIRQWFLGRRNLRGVAAKKQVMAKCKSLGINPRNDNEADAAALWFYATQVGGIGVRSTS